MVVTLGPGQQLQIERLTARPRVSQLRLAAVIGINRATLSSYENEWRTPPEGWERFSLRFRSCLRDEVRKARAK